MSKTASESTPEPASSPEQASVPSFTVISGNDVQQALQGQQKKVVDIVEAAYRLHGAARTVNPPSYFLRFPDRPTSRIIALPASIGGSSAVDGIKWISSFPENVAAGIPRASAVLVLNDHETGYPFACLESSIISATRTAASAALAADRLSRQRQRPRRVGFVGVGLIARYIHTYLQATDWAFDSIGIHDLSDEHARGFKSYLDRTETTAQITVHDSAEELVRSSDLVIFATVAGTPHVHETDWFSHHPLVLNVSLRDLAPEIILSAVNVVDDVEHCLKADTSPHLAEKLSGNRDFVDGTINDVLSGQLSVPADRTVVFSPFGLGVLDLAVGKYIYDEITAHGEPTVVTDFFSELRRYG